METKYKTSNTLLKLREYGRNIQEMVEYCKTVEDDVKRNALAKEIVRIMSNISPNVKDMPDYRQKLWDHFYHMADYNIRVDGDFPMPEPRDKFVNPKTRMEYTEGKPRFRQYGRNVELMIKEALRIEDGAERMALVNLIANIMRQHLRDSDRDSNAELTILEHLKVLSNGELQYRREDIRFYQGKPKQPPQKTYDSPRDRKGGGYKKGKKSNHKYRR